MLTLDLPSTMTQYGTPHEWLGSYRKQTTPRPWSTPIFDPTLGGLYDDIPLPFDDTNRRSHLGSSFQNGYYGYARRAIRMALGSPVSGALSVLRCADGTLTGRRAALVRSLRDSIAVLGSNP
jgi:hypothetical protein